MNKLVKSVKKFTKKMTLTHLLVALLVVALVVAVVHSQTNQENFDWMDWYKDILRRQREEAARIVEETRQARVVAEQVVAHDRRNAARPYTRKTWKMPKWDRYDTDTNISMNKWIEKQIKYLQIQDNGKLTTGDSTWETKCALRGKITVGGEVAIAPVDLAVESANLKAIGEQDVYTDLTFKKCQAICDFHAAPETSQGQWEGGCTGFNITYHKSGGKPEAAECVFYSNKTVGYLPVRKWGFGLTDKLNTQMRKNWNTKAKVEQSSDYWWGLNHRTAKWTYWPRKELSACQ